MYYRGADGIILVFDLYKRQTFANLNEWIKEVEKHAKENVSIIVIGNKSDKKDEEEREVTDEDIKKFTRDTGIRVYEASAKTGANVESSFLTLTEELMEKSVISEI